MTREEKNILFHTTKFDGMVYAGTGTANYSKAGIFNDASCYCIRSNTLAKLLLSIHTIVHAKLHGLPAPTPESDILVATFGDRGIIFMDTVTYDDYDQYVCATSIEHWIINQLLSRSYGLNPNITIKPAGIILDFGEDGKFYLSEDFHPTHQECITMDYKCNKEIKKLLHAEYIASTKRTQFVGYQIFDMKTKEEAQ